MQEAQKGDAIPDEQPTEDTSLGKEDTATPFHQHINIEDGEEGGLKGELENTLLKRKRKPTQKATEALKQAVESKTKKPAAKGVGKSSTKP